MRVECYKIYIPINLYITLHSDETFLQHAEWRSRRTAKRSFSLPHIQKALSFFLSFFRLKANGKRKHIIIPFVSLHCHHLTLIATRLRGYDEEESTEHFAEQWNLTISI